MPKNLFNYQFDLVTASWGEIRFTGYQRGDGITIVPDNDDWSLLVGNRGEGVRSKLINQSFTITVNLHQASPDNLKLSNARNLDLTLGTGARPLLIQDKGGFSLFKAERCWIQRAPDTTYADEAGVRAWTLRTHNGTLVVGGNLIA